MAKQKPHQPVCLFIGYCLFSMAAVWRSVAGVLVFLMLKIEEYYRKIKCQKPSNRKQDERHSYGNI